MTFCKKNQVNWSFFAQYMANIVRQKNTFLPIFDDFYISVQTIRLLDLLVTYSDTFGLSIRGKRRVQYKHVLNKHVLYNFLKLCIGN